MLVLLKTVFYIPLYNGLIFLIGLLPGASVGSAVIVLTLLVKLLLFPLSQKASKFQLEMKAHEGEINQIKERFKNDKQAQGQEILKFYRQNKINPFAGILPLFVQIPIVIALYYVFYKGGLPAVDTTLLYPFLSTPIAPDMHFLGIDMGQKSLLLAILAGISQFLQAHFAMPPFKPKEKGTQPSFQDDLARGMQMQMKYFFPFFMAFVSYAVSGAVAIYFITSNLFAVGQELYLRRKFQKEGHLTHPNK